jgi:hypothetical protein
MVQLNPSTKRETSGFAVEVKSSYCVVGGECTWSKEKNWRFGAEPEDAGDAAAGGAVPGAVAGVDSIAIVVEEVA